MQLRSRYLAVWTVVLLGCSTGSAGLGDSCGGDGDCASGLQCLGGVCEPKCQRAPECGDGYSCTSDGYCRVATGQPGDTCTSHVDCVAGLACELDGTTGSDGTLHASCVGENAARPVAAECNVDADCRDATCALGHCVDLCADTRDCAAGTSCTRIPRIDAGGTTYVGDFPGCLQSVGSLTWSIPIAGPGADVYLPIPGGATPEGASGPGARSAAITFTVDDPAEQVGVTSLVDPMGNQLVADPAVTFWQQQVRHQPAIGQSVLAMPSQPVDLVPGAYKMHVTSLRPPFGLGLVGTSTPTTTVVVKLDDGALLDLHFYFLDFTSHPCDATFAGATLNAKLASTSSFFQNDFLGELRVVFSHGGVALGAATYEDVLDHPELDGLDVADAGSLFALGANRSGVNVFFVRTLSPVGLQAFGPPGPGPAGLASTHQSGIAIALDTLCYRTWTDVARLTAHELARYMGLYDTSEFAHPDRIDPINPNDDNMANLMFYSEFGGTDLSAGQQTVLSRSVVLR